MNRAYKRWPGCSNRILQRQGACDVPENKPSPQHAVGSVLESVTEAYQHRRTTDSANVSVGQFYFLSNENMSIIELLIPLWYQAHLGPLLLVATGYR